MGIQNETASAAPAAENQNIEATIKHYEESRKYYQTLDSNLLAVASQRIPTMLQIYQHIQSGLHYLGKQMPADVTRDINIIRGEPDNPPSPEAFMARNKQCAQIVHDLRQLGIQTFTDLLTAAQSEKTKIANRGAVVEKEVIEPDPGKEDDDFARTTVSEGPSAAIEKQLRDSSMKLAATLPRAILELAQIPRAIRQLEDIIATPGLPADVKIKITDTLNILNNGQDMPLATIATIIHRQTFLALQDLNQPSTPSAAKSANIATPQAAFAPTERAPKFIDPKDQRREWRLPDLHLPPKKPAGSTGKSGS